jgi:hypothetical protein
MVGLQAGPSALALAVLAVGCSDGGFAPPTSSPADRPAFNYSNGPGTPGQSGVIRFGDFVGIFVVDPEHGLLSIHSTSTPLAQICTGTPPVVDILEIQLLEAASGLHALFQGDEHNVLIYPVPTFPVATFDCSVLVSLPLLAAGQVRLIRTDNDLTAGGQPGANAFGWQATGVLTDLQNGGTLHYNEIVRPLITPFSTEIQELVVNIDLH